MALSDLRTRLVEFARFARAAGCSIGLAETEDLMHIATSSRLASREVMFNSTRALFCKNPTEWEAFPALFANFWDRGIPLAEERSETRSSAEGGLHETEGASPGIQADKRRKFAGLGGSSSKISGAGAGDYEVLSRADFRFLRDAAQLRHVASEVERIARVIRRRLPKRWRCNRESGIRIDFPHTMRRSLAYGGWPLERRFIRRSREFQRLVLILDISQSMEVYSQLFLRFAWAFALRLNDTHTFAFHVRLLDLRKAMRESSSERLLDKLEPYSSLWLGGTRVGESIAEFNTRYAGRVLNRRTLLLIVSDGCDSQAQTLLPQEMEKLHRRAGRVLWLNPLLGRDKDETSTPVSPMERGLHDSLPFIDYYGPAHNLQALHQLQRYLARQ